jgi:hypothetical protein
LRRSWTLCAADRVIAGTPLAVRPCDSIRQREDEAVLLITLVRRRFSYEQRAASRTCVRQCSRSSSVEEYRVRSISGLEVTISSSSSLWPCCWRASASAFPHREDLADRSPRLGRHDEYPGARRAFPEEFPFLMGEVSPGGHCSSPLTGCLGCCLGHRCVRLSQSILAVAARARRRRRRGACATTLARRPPGLALCRVPVPPSRVIFAHPGGVYLA